MDYVIGLDIGTTNIKALAFNSEGKVLGEASKSVSFLPTSSERSEQNPDTICKLSLECLKEVIRKVQGHLRGIGLSSAMHSVIALDADKNLLTNSITWADLRSASIADELQGSPLGKSLFQNSGTPIHPLSPLLKIKWLQRNQPDLFNRVKWFTEIKGYLIFRFTGMILMDQSIASATGLYNSSSLEWIEEALDFAGISPSILPEVIQTKSIIKQNSEEFLAATKTSETVPIIIGGSDGCLANLGANCLTPDKAILNMGTSAAIRIATPRPITDPTGGIFKYLLFDKLFICGGASNNAGNVLKWWISKSESTLSIQDYINSLVDTTSDSSGPVFIPWIFGERPPAGSASSSGGFHGSIIEYSNPELFRKVVEGLLLNFFTIFNQLEKLSGAKIKSLTITGGLSSSDIIAQMIADIFGLVVNRQSGVDHSALGAALIAMNALDVIDSYNQVLNSSTGLTQFNPNKDLHIHFQNYYKHYLDVSKNYV